MAARINRTKDVLKFKAGMPGQVTLASYDRRFCPSPPEPARIPPVSIPSMHHSPSRCVTGLSYFPLLSSSMPRFIGLVASAAA